MKLAQVFCLISSLTAAIALPNPSARNGLEVSERGGSGIAFLKGKIEVKDASGASIGFISKFKSDFGTYVAEKDEDHAAIFTFAAKTYGKTSGLLLKDETTDTKKTPYLGGVVPHGYNLEKGGGRKRATAGAAKGSGTAGSAPNSPPHAGGNSYNAQHGPAARSLPEARGDDDDDHHHSKSNDFESAIWTYNAKTKAFSAVWTNPDHSHLDLTFFYDTCKPFGLVLVSDVNGYSFSNPEAFKISLHFVPKHGKKDW